MKWISNLYQILSRSVSVEESWVHMTTSLRQSDLNIRHRSKSSQASYVSGALLVNQVAEPVNLQPVKHQRQDIFPSVLNRLEGKLKVNRISAVKKK